MGGVLFNLQKVFLIQRVFDDLSSVRWLRFAGGSWAGFVDTFCDETRSGRRSVTAAAPSPPWRCRQGGLLSTPVLPDPGAEELAFWPVGRLLRAVAGALDRQFNPVAVEGEISGFSRAASGHCYFNLKDEQGQLRCAMFRRAADQLRFVPRDGQWVELQGKLDLYGPRGDLQLIVERMRPAGQGALYERFLRLKAELEAEGLFDPARKRALVARPDSIGVVTSLGAAALRDVLSALQRRVPHLPVCIYPSAVQGAAAAAELCAALRAAYAQHQRCGQPSVLLLVRGGGSLEDLWSFNDEALVRTLAEAPMPVISGVGHETDFTLADFVADLRAPTPTAAAELCAPPRQQQLDALDLVQAQCQQALMAGLDQRSQRLDQLSQRLSRPSARVHDSRQALLVWQHRLQTASQRTLQRQQNRLQTQADRLPAALLRQRQQNSQRLQRCEAALGLLDPSLVLQRGYAFLTDGDGAALTRAADATPGQALNAHLSDGVLALQVTGRG